MLDASAFRELVSGRRRSAGAALARGVLRLAELPYTAAINWRNRRYDRNPAAAIRVDVPVVSVGNLTLGGTGKTPMVKWIAGWFAARNVRVAIVSRGYCAATGTKNDEALELEQSLPGVPHWQNPDRVAGARSAIDRSRCELVVLDDGFQHRRLARDLDIVLLDATEPFGFGHVFPRGTLREPLCGLSRANVVCLTRADALGGDGRNSIRRRVAELAPHALWCEAVHAPSHLRSFDGRVEPLSSLLGRRVAAFCGIGNPAAFRRTLESLGAQVVSWHEFADHHSYDTTDQEKLGAAISASRAETVVSTHKDLVKLPLLELAGCPLWALAIEMQFTAGGAELEQSLARIAPQNVTS